MIFLAMISITTCYPFHQQQPQQQQTAIIISFSIEKFFSHFPFKGFSDAAAYMCTIIINGM